MASALIPTSQLEAGSVEKVLLQGDLERLSPGERLNYYQAVCESLGLNPLTRPFEYIKLNGKLTLYAKRECTEQLRSLHKVSITITSREFTEGCYVVTAKAHFPDNRTDESIGAVAVEGLKGEARANAMMKAETKAKRRVTMAICGLSMLDETEVETIPSAQRYTEMREAADARQTARLAAVQAVPDEIVLDANFIDPDEQRPVFNDEPGLGPPHDQELRDSIKKFGVPPTKRAKKSGLELTPKQIDMLQAFAGLKKSLNAIKRVDVYYEKLGAYGVEHSNQFPDTPEGIKQARECYAEMRIACGDAQAEAAAQKEPA